MANRAHLALLVSSVTDFNAWRKENPRERPDLSKANLSGKILAGADLSGCDLSNANLSRCDLTGCLLEGAALRDCNFADAIGAPDVETPLADLLRRSVAAFHARRQLLSDQDDVEEIDLSGEDFSGCDLTDADLSYCNLTNADFRKATLRGTNFQEATLEGAKFASADVTDANLDPSEFETDVLLDLVRGGYDDLTGVDLSGQNLSEIDLTKCTVEDMDLSNCVLDGVRIRGDQLTENGPNLNGATGTLILVES